MEKQTAVEWFFMTMNIRGLLPNEEIIECYEQAKELEKKQITDAHTQGYVIGGGNGELYDCKQYYNEIFKSE
jgi:hypothetical protein